MSMNEAPDELDTGARNVSIQVNGQHVQQPVLPRTHLVDFLRESLGLKGSHLVAAVRLQAVDPASHAHIEDAAVQSQQQFHLARRGFAAVGPTKVAAALAHQAREQLLAQQGEVAVGDVAVAQAGGDEHAHPVALQDALGVQRVEARELGLDVQRLVVEQLFPPTLPAGGEQVGVDTLDQGLLRREIVVQQRMGDAQFLGQIAQLPVQPLLGEEAHSTFDDESLALGRREATALRAGLVGTLDRVFTDGCRHRPA